MLAFVPEVTRLQRATESVENSITVIGPNDVHDLRFRFMSNDIYHTYHLCIHIKQQSIQLLTLLPLINPPSNLSQMKTVHA